MLKNSNKVQCKICGNYYYSIFPSHLKRHGISLKEYLNMFPNSSFQSKELALKRSKSASKINKGRKLSLDSKKKISDTLVKYNSKRELINRYGSKFHGFFGNKREALKKDKFTCQGLDCRKNSNRLEVHHIDDNPKNNDLSNLITLCRSCHARIHNLTLSKEQRLKGLKKRRKND